MSTPRQFTIDELQRYVNDTADLTLRAAIETAANDDPSLADRIANLDPWRDVVGPVVDAVPITTDSEQMVQALTNAASTHAAAQAKATLLKTVLPAGLAVALAAGLLGAYVMLAVKPDTQAPVPPVIEQPQPKPVETKPAGDAPPQDLVAQAKPTWLNAVADYVKLMTPKTFASQESPEELQAALAAFDAELGVEARKLINSVPELKLQRAELLQLNGRPLGQLAFLDADNNVIAICVISRKARPEGLAENTVSAPKEAELQGLNIVSWDHNTHGYLVIGKTTPATLGAMAEKLMQKI
jgi:hypothetical protein